MKMNIILSFLAALFLFFNVMGISVVCATVEQTEGVIVQERTINEQKITEVVEENADDFWETMVIRLNRLVYILVNFFREIWGWIKNIFEAGIERVEEYQPRE